MSKNVKDVLSSAASAAGAQNGTFWLLSPWGHPEVTLRSPWGHHRAFSNAFISGLRFRAERCQQHIAEIALAALASHLVASHDYHHSELSKKGPERRTKYAKAASANINQRIKNINQKSHVWRLAWKLGLQPCVKKRMHTLNNPTLGLEIIGSSLETRPRLGHLNPQMETSSEIASMVVMTKQC